MLVTAGAGDVGVADEPPSPPRHAAAVATRTTAANPVMSLFIVGPFW
ncbi:MAG TPA: hypothetical protein VFT95_11345 [Micromonosporaceae bacterium]|nr:hypothetical protein [Micromonosporaceae bacterium]